ncbi:MAG: sigma-54-dependent Fis family transcriptional regulator [Gammaproteobacteria bacterium]|nr:sigma-54-dependent Fis family transcriptional regulator [Gammaproteobacteria bacterium]
MADTLLIIEDEKLLGKEMRRRFVKQGWDVTLVEDLAGARRELIDEELEPLIVLADMNLPDGNSLDLLKETRAGTSQIGEWILMTAYGTIPDSVRALQLGAHDFLEKPVDDARLDMAVRRTARSARAHRRLSSEAASQVARHGPARFIGRSDRAEETRHMLDQIAQADFSALVLRGETGTGKGLAAKILHYNGPRAEGPIVEVNCAALPGELLESELFGHEAGAFTGAKGRRAGLFEQADGGTLFLDEIGEMPMNLQAKLLKAVEDRTVRRVGGSREIRIDVRIIAATNRDLEQEVVENRFRSDLFHRLSVFQVVLPSLAERPEDIEDLVQSFITEFNDRTNRRIRQVPDEVWSELKGHQWPGNVRELRNVIERCVLLSRGSTLERRWLQLGSATNGGPQVEGDRISFPLDGSISLDEIERRMIEAALQRTRGNVTRAAAVLGISRQTMRYRIEKHAIDTRVSGLA